MSLYDALDFTAIDFETANEKRGSVIQVGMARVKDGQLMDTVCRPIRLHPSLHRFNPRNIAVHGLDASYIKGAPGWPDVLEFILDFAGDPTHLVAHNASVERACIDQASDAWGVVAPPLKWLDTMALGKTVMKTLDPAYRGGYGLEPLAGYFQVPDFGHHDAGEDAAATARLALRIAERTGHLTVRELWRVTGSMKPRTQTVQRVYAR